MKKFITRITAICFAALIFLSVCVPVAFTAQEDVSDVIARLEAIDTLQQMQNKRATYGVSKNWDASDPDIVAEHTAARNGYDTYLAEMFAARLAAAQAYEALSEAEKAQVPAELVAKLDDTLPTVYNFNKHSTITRRFDEYCYEVIFPKNLVYEMCNHFSPGLDMPATIIVTNTAELATTDWAPDGPYSYGTNNYNLTYCCDLDVTPVDKTHYKLVNLEDGAHYSTNAAKHIRTIVENAYPFITVDEMKSNLKSLGLDPDFVDSLNRSDIICAVQMAIWAYSNMSKEKIDQSVFYGGSLDMSKVPGIMTPIHNYNNELWDWWSTVSKRLCFSDESSYKVNNLVYFLFSLPGKDADEEQLIITDVQVTRAQLRPGSSDTYDVGIYVTLNGNVEADDNIEIKVKSGHNDGEGNFITTDSFTVSADSKSRYPMSVTAKEGDTVTVETKGIQNVARGVYLYEPEGGKDASQTLVGITEGPVRIGAKQTFTFSDSIEKGLRIYKTSNEDGTPIAGVTFDVYRADGSVNDEPTDEETAMYSTDANRVGSVVTDDTGYAALALENGKYLVCERENPEKVKAPAEPFYITVPMPVEGTQGEYTDIASVYPKNTPAEPDGGTPELIIPDNVSGTFSLVKHKKGDTSHLLEGAQFKVYRPALSDDTETVTLHRNGLSYRAVPVVINGEELILRSDENGRAESPALPCGVYYLQETKAPRGYHKSADMMTVTVVQNLADRPAEILYVPNESAQLLPETGGAGVYIIIGAGVLLMVASVALLLKKKKSD
ncbi:MAG: Cys-Gln thioester bond-forming surface protein [Clostridia bacterium]|nr:Cys-Gln thioester bond-forming surface protein [Clostridia bacterium]